MCRVGCAPVGSPRLAWLASSLLFSWVALRENFCQVAVQPWILLNPSPLFEHLPVRGWGGGGVDVPLLHTHTTDTFPVCLIRLSDQPPQANF